MEDQELRESSLEYVVQLIESYNDNSQGCPWFLETKKVTQMADDFYRYLQSGMFFNA